ncbi:ABC transporter permease [Kineosporia sp. R_H_3]|uniref:ABC transporter permease n=1 Tax=Kineosporia sp. R_H_3 TaxID=1961848 RepID=UPI000B4BB7B5|nr:ABC transporter permease subunit [Kineosporia sp. R_H_3]
MSAAGPDTEQRAARRAGLRVAVLLAPALLVVVGLFGTGLGLGLLQSLGYQPYLPGWSWTTDAYTGLLDDRAVRASFVLTLRMSVLATAGSAVLALGIAMLVHSTRRGRRLLTAVLQVGLPVPHLVGALAMSLMLSQSGLLSRLAYAAGLTSSPADFPALTQDRFGWAVLAEYLWKETPFVTIVALTALARGVAPLQDVAATLGARPWQRFRHVVLPLVAPAVGAASVVVLAFTFGSYEVPAVLGRPYPAPLAVVAYQRFTDTDLAVRPQAVAIGVVLAVAVTALVAVYLRLLDRLGTAR